MSGDIEIIPWLKVSHVEIFVRNFQRQIEASSQSVYNYKKLFILCDY